MTQARLNVVKLRVFNLTQAELAGGMTEDAYPIQYEVGDVRRYGCVLDGVTDDTTAFQLAIDTNKGKTVTIPTGELYCSGVVMNGSSYNGTRIICNGGELKLKVRVGSGAPTVGLSAIDCSHIILDLKWNGNRANQPDTEYVHCVALQGVTNCYIPRFEAREIRGDGMYITQKDTAVESTQSTDIVIDSFSVYNTADDGRNALSIIAGERILIGNFVSYKVGGVIGGVKMPGGFDIEPNYGYQYCRDITVNNMLIQHAGNSGLAIIGKAVTDDTTRDWNCQRINFNNFTVKKTGSDGVGITLQRCSHVYMKGTKSRDVPGIGFGYQFDYMDHFVADIKAIDITIGAFFGYNDWVNDFDVRIIVEGYSNSGLRAGGVKRGRFTGRVYGATSASSTFAITAASNNKIREQVNVVYSVDAPYDGNNVRAFRLHTDTFGAGTYAADCNWDGYTSPSVQCDAAIPTQNIFGRNVREHTAQPSSGTWVAGDIVWRSNPAMDGSNMLLVGWIRLTTGTGNVAGTDWRNIRVSDVSPAT